jgi:hypothetical protein
MVTFLDLPRFPGDAGVLRYAQFEFFWVLIMAGTWDVESLRLSLFSTQSVSISDADWKAIIGKSEAQTIQVLPGVKRYVGKFDDGQLTLAAAGQRADLVFSYYLPIEPSDTQELKLHIIGPWDNVRETFVQSTRTWLNSLTFPIVRIGFGAVLLLQTGTRLEAYQKLKLFLKSIDVDPNGMHDLLFRINWPQQSAVVDGLTLNRMTNWAAMRFNVAMLQLTSGVIGSTPISELIAVRLEIDNNTDVERKKPFDCNELVSIYEELVEMACENATKGERP